MISFDFLNIRIADSLSVFWALRIILHIVLRTVHSAKLKENDLVIKTCARSITKSVPYFMRPDTGYLGMQWIIFPLETALSAFQQMRQENEWKWSRDALAVVEIRGIRYGGDIVEAQWGEQIK